MFILIFTGFLVKKLFLHAVFPLLVSQVYGTKRGSYNYEKGFLCPFVLASISRAVLGYRVPRPREASDLGVCQYCPDLERLQRTLEPRVGKQRM